MEFFTNLIYEYGLIAMFLLILLEYACFPVSSEIVLPFSGAVASLNGIAFPIILLTSMIAGIIGVSVCYFLGRLGGSSILLRIMKKFPKTEKGITSSMNRFQHYGMIAVCIGRVIPICRTYISFVAGAAKQPYPTFIFASAIGIAVWNTLLIGIGYICRENWNQIKVYYEEYKHFILIGFAIFILFLLIKKSRKQETKNDITK